MKNKWKVIAIIFIIISILEFGVLYWAWNAGTEMIEKENTCSINICTNYDAYYYQDNNCYCYDNGEIVHQEYMG